MTQPFTPITLQHIFNLAWQRFIVEQAPPAAQEGTCRYLTSDGKKCAIGLALPDVSPITGLPYTWRSTEVEFSRLVEVYPELFDEKIVRMSIDSLNTFQRALHDRYITCSEWDVDLPARRLAYLSVAREYNLRVPGIDSPVPA